MLSVPCTRPPKRGAGLIVVLWVIALLALLISGFAFDMHVEARIVSYCRRRLKAEYLARAGLERARMLLERSRTIRGDDTDSEEVRAKPWYNEAKQLRRGSGVQGITDQLGEGTVILDIIPVPARRNVNALKDEDWERVLRIGGVPEELWSQLIDSFNDWRDADDQPNIDGAETEDYYARLEPPYKARGHKGQAANLDTVDELLLIRGFTRSIVHGGYLVEDDTNSVWIAGIADLLTTDPDAGAQVNVNAASKRVLLTLPGVTETVADAILAAREGLTEDGTAGEDLYFKDVADLFKRVPELATLSTEDQTALRGLISFASRVFRVVSRGRVHGVEYTMTSTVKL